MNKPKFNPSLPFEPAETPAVVKPKFDASKPFEVARDPGSMSNLSLRDMPSDKGVSGEGQAGQGTEQLPQEAPSLLDRAQTQLESFGNTVSMGYLPHIQAAFERMTPDAAAGTDEHLRAQGFDVPERGYVQARDENINRQQQQEARNPYDAMAGSLAGIAVQAPLIASGASAAGLGKGVGVASRVKDAVTTGFGLGAVANPGDTEGQVNPLQGQERLKNAGTGAAFGAGGQALGEGVAKAGEVVRNSPETLKKIANSSAFKAAGAMLKDFRKNSMNGKSVEEIGNTMLNKGVVAAGDTFEDIARKASLAKQETGKTIGDTYKKVEDIIDAAGATKTLSRADRLRLKASELDGAKIAKSARGVILKGAKNDPSNSKINEKIQATLEALESRGKNLTMKDLLEMKGNIDGDINYSKEVRDMPVVQERLKIIRDHINKALQDRVRVAGKIVKDESLISSLKTANKEYGHLSAAESAAKDRMNRENANRYFSLGEKLIGGAAFGNDLSSDHTPEDYVKSAIKGLAVAQLAKTGRTYGLPVVARTSKYIGERLKKPAAFAKFGQPLIEAAKRSPQEFQALLNQFGKDPEFIKITNLKGATP